MGIIHSNTLIIQALSYLSDNCQPVSDSRPRRLRSSDSLSCFVRRAHNTYGDWCFATAGPRVWNSLPAELQQCSSLRQFKRCLKTFLFGSCHYGALWLFVKQRRVEIVLLTYLLTYSLPTEHQTDSIDYEILSEFFVTAGGDCWAGAAAGISFCCSWWENFILCSAIFAR